MAFIAAEPFAIAAAAALELATPDTLPAPLMLEAAEVVAAPEIASATDPAEFATAFDMAIATAETLAMPNDWPDAPLEARTKAAPAAAAVAENV